MKLMRFVLVTVLLVLMVACSDLAPSPEALPDAELDAQATVSVKFNAAKGVRIHGLGTDCYSSTSYVSCTASGEVGQKIVARVGSGNRWAYCSGINGGQTCTYTLRKGDNGAIVGGADSLSRRR